MRSNQRLELEGDLFHFLMRLIQENNHAHDTLFHFLTSLTQAKELFLWSLFHFLTSLTQVREPAHGPCFNF